MLRKIAFCFTLFLLCSCSEVIDHVVETTIDNAIPEPDKLLVGVKNNTHYIFTRTEIVTRQNGTYVYQQVAPGNLSEFHEFANTYSEAEIRIHTDYGGFSFTPLFYDEATKVTKGIYYYEISVLEDNETISINRVEL